MSKKKNKKNMQEQEEPLQNEQTATNEQQTPAEEAQPTADDRVKQLEEELEKQKKEYLFLMADFDNFRKRTSKEKLDLIKNGAESAMRDLLPVVDDLERALAAVEQTDDVASVKEGIDLIYNKFMKYLQQQHVTPIESTGADFDPEVHEAVTTFPAPDPAQKGKVIDTTTKGYMINDKVLRHAKVVVGQ